MMVGDIKEIVSDQQLTLTTSIMLKDKDTHQLVEKVDEHPVLVPKAVMATIKADKRLAFKGWIRRHPLPGGITKLQLNPESWTQKPKDIKALAASDKYSPKFNFVGDTPFLNTGSVAGLVVWNNPLDNDPKKANNVTVGIANPGTAGEAIYSVVWNKFAKALVSMLQINTVEVLIDGYMRSRAMTGSRLGDFMYELNGSDRGASRILSFEPIKTLLDDTAGEMETAMAFVFDDDAPAANPAPAGSPPAPDADDVPF